MRDYESTVELIDDAHKACSDLEDRLRREGWGNLTRQVAFRSTASTTI